MSLPQEEGKYSHADYLTWLMLQENGRYGRPEIYTEDEKIKVSIFPDLIIDLNLVFGTI
jgi:hypothetical protein